MSLLTPKVFIQHMPPWDNYSIYIKCPSLNDDINFLICKVSTTKSPVDFKPFMDPGTIGIDPFQFMQAMLDAIWEKGLRPTGYKDFQNEIVAIKYHLEDMRKLVFK